MTLGPIELIAISFPGNKFKGEIAPALMDLVEDDIIRVIDAVFVTKDNADNISIVALSDMDDAVAEKFNTIISSASSMLEPEDVEELLDKIERNSSAAILLFEHVWARRVVEMVSRADGRLVLDARVPGSVVEQVKREAVPA
jgi:uncharacterized membrane protein